MKERPILFSAPMVRALLDGSKTQTRRVMKAPWDECNGEPIYRCGPDGHGFRADKLPPYGQPGDRLWVRETFGEVYDWCDHPEMPGAPTERWHIEWKYRADGEPDRQSLDGALTGWKPSIHMPRAASRILLEIVSVRVERLNDCSAADARAEGLHRYPYDWRDCEFPLDDVAYEPFKGFGTRYSCASQAYRALWESINGTDSWAANPWVWVVEFKRLVP